MRMHESALLSPQQRLRELARILAAGLRRQRAIAAAAGERAAPNNPPNSVSNCLEVPPETRLTVQDG
jgi:hypothetical protein